MTETTRHYADLASQLRTLPRYVVRLSYILAVVCHNGNGRCLQFDEFDLMQTFQVFEEHIFAILYFSFCIELEKFV